MARADGNNCVSYHGGATSSIERFFALCTRHECEFYDAVTFLALPTLFCVPLPSGILFLPQASTATTRERMTIIYD